MAAILELQNLTKKFGGLTAVGDLSLSVQEKEIYGLIGPNGAGKTTVFNLITAIYRPSSGQILFNGQRIDGKSPSEIACAGITRTFQNIRLFKEMSVYENVLTACHLNAGYNVLDSLLRLPRYFKGERLIREETDELLQRMGLYDRKDDIAKNLPYGNQRRLEIARAVALHPKLLLLDEPAAGMNPDETFALLDSIRKIRDDFSLTVLVIEHHMDLVMNLCEKIMVINFGKELAEGTPEDVQNNPDVIEAYLGEKEEQAADLRDGEEGLPAESREEGEGQTPESDGGGETQRGEGG